jgi:UDPglucose 6-dehydrogenase
MTSTPQPAPHRTEDGVHSSSIGVVGAGVVGQILVDYFQGSGRPVHVYDKYKALGSIEEVNQASLVFICVPTPYVEGFGLDASAIRESLALLGAPRTVVIRSTVLPGTTDALATEFPEHHLLFNPEFLREKTAAADFMDPERQIVGYSRAEDKPLAEQVLSLLPRAPFEVVVPAGEAEMIKVATNSFLALKVIFANEIFDLCNALAIDYESVKAGLYADPRLGGSHFDVYDGGYRGFGGKCLPKDSAGLLDLSLTAGATLELLMAAQSVNERLSAITRAEAA